MRNLISGLFCFTLGLLLTLMYGTAIVMDLTGHLKLIDKQSPVLGLFVIGCISLGMGIHNIIKSAIAKK